MYATLDFVKRKFAEYNVLIFSNKLPLVPIQLTRAAKALGCLHIYKISHTAGQRCPNYKLTFSSAYDLPQEELEDIIIHEMIHLYIAVNKIQDTSAHGEEFKNIMNKINTTFGRNISISSRLSEEVRSTSRSFKKHYLITFKYGVEQRECIMRCASTFVFEAYRLLRIQSNVSDIRFYGTVNPYFNRFPNSRTLRFFYLTEKDRANLIDTVRLIMNNGHLCPV